MSNDSKKKVFWLPGGVEQRYSSITETRQKVVFPWLINSILERTPSSILDYGAGSGHFLELLRGRFCRELFYFDPSSTMVDLARERMRRCNVEICKSPQSLREGSIDIVTSVAVWMTIGSYQGCLEYLSAQRRVLRPGGSALVAVTHPCFREEKYSSFATNFNNNRYLDHGAAFDVSVFDQECRVEFVDYHWSLTVMLRQAAEVGLQLKRLTELPDVPNGNSRGAPWICFELSKE